PAEGRGRTLGRQIASSLALLVLIAGLLSAGVLALHVRVTAALQDSHEDDFAAREALGLALAVREHYLHETHTVIQGDSGQVHHHHHWIDDLEARIAALEGRVPAAQRQTLEELRATSRAIDRRFREELLPAALAGDMATVRAQQQSSELLLSQATSAADALVEALDARAEATRGEALARSRLAIIVGVIGVLIIGVAAVVVAARLRRAVLAPLGRLTAAARRFGAGDFEHRIGSGELPELVELRTVSHALDSMAGELRARERRLLQTERIAAIGQLTAGIAHEINNPIGVIRGYLKTMIPAADQGQIDAGELGEELRILDEEAAACQRIVDDLLSFAREPQLRRESVVVAALLEDAVRRFSSALPKVKVVVEVAGEGPVSVDPLRMQQVLANLLHNAAAAGGEQPITLRAKHEDQGWVIEVRDRGPGIAADKRERIFEPFFSERHGGSGLGLAICRSIVEAHGGRVFALAPEDEEEDGAVLRIELFPGQANRESQP
ncbi:MAG: HAMP domain-containing protein, partial [Myxococcales bacterium]|nr:HAMP domain-containing protein [Myxococcales bacterium]